MRKLFAVAAMMLVATVGISAKNQGPVLTIDGGQVQAGSMALKTSMP